MNGEANVRPLRIWLYFAAGLVGGAYIHGLSNDRMLPVFCVAGFVVLADVIWPMKRREGARDDYSPVTVTWKWEFSLDKFLGGFRKKPQPPKVE